ncbi:MAG: hypothetical protein HWD59_05710 [Coxiellaceae bacterium]|nr:MAG: hypothetical protein HWD59_05710 [Coxiellaceae bacterium]
MIQECMAAVKECKKNYQAACEEYGLVVPEGASLILQDSYLQACVQKT